MFFKFSHKAHRAVFLTSTVLASAFSGIALAQSSAQPADTTDLDNGAVKTLIVRAERSKAAATAPSKASLDQGQPSSIISRPFIELSTPESADYTSIATISPSLAGAGANQGAGWGEAKVTFRGIKDGQYNVTYDGVPWGDTNNPTHHSNSFFPASTIGAVIVDRGPGVAGDLGQESFGGNIKLFSNKISDDFGVTLRETLGTWNSWQSVAVIQTGKIDALGGMSGFINLQANSSDGQLTYSPMHSSNQTVKFKLPINDDWQVTLFATHNYNISHQTDNGGATLAQVAKYGKNFNLSNDPTKSHYYGYNNFNKETHFEYLKVDGKLPLGFVLDNTLYGYFYDNNTFTGTDVAHADVAPTDTANWLKSYGTFTTTAKVAGAPAITAANPNFSHIQGYNKLNHYYNWGNVLRLNRPFSFGTLHTGLWLETSKTDRHTYDYDATLGTGQNHSGVPDKRESKICQAYVTNSTTCLTPTTAADKTDPYNLLYAATSYEEQSSWWQTEVFADFEWHLGDKLTLTPGVKSLNFTRKVTAPVIKSPRRSQYASDTFTKTLKFFTANYKLLKNWSVYAQYADGFEAPEIADLYVIDPSKGNAEPTTTKNYQVGTVYQSNHIAIDLDAYRVESDNLFATDSSGLFLTNFGKARYRGVEGQISYAFDMGLTLFVNGSTNSGESLTGTGYVDLPSVPKSTLGYGGLFHSGNWSSSLLYKQVGEQYIKTNPNSYKIDAYDSTDLAVAYDFGRYRIKTQITNLLDHRDVTNIKTGSSSTASVPNSVFDQYTFQAGRNVQVTLIAKF